MSDRTPVVEARGIAKRYGRHWALRGVELEVGRGERVALLGPNGAGKSTLLRLAATLTRPTRGALRVCGLDTDRETRAVRRLIGVAGHRPPLYDDLSARENLLFYAALYGVPHAKARAAELLGRAGLVRAGNERVGGYSRGMQQRLALVRALLHDPPLLLLDEPETGLDQEARALLESVIRSGEGRTVLFSTHDHELARALADRAVVLAGGEIVHDGAAADLAGPLWRETYAALGAGARG